MKVKVIKLNQKEFKVETNKYGTNKAIIYTILSDDEMRKIGFTDYNKPHWYFSKLIKFPKDKKYKGFEISFGVTIPKNGEELRIDVLDEDFCQPYDYQNMLNDNPYFEPCLIIKEQVEEWMKYLEEQGVLHGHKYGEYI